MSLTPDTVVRRSPHPVSTTVGKEVILMTLEEGECIGLGLTGSDVWRLLAEPQPLGKLTAELRQIYEAPPGVLEADVQELLETMQKHRLVEF